MRLTDAHIRSLQAPFYEKACLDPDVDMIAFAELMNYLDSCFKKTNPHSVWSALSIDREKYDNPTYIKYLVAIEEAYYEMLAPVIISEIEQFQANNTPEKTYTFWLQQFASALVEWDSYVYTKLLEVDIQDKEVLLSRAKFKKLHNHILNDYWEPARDTFLALAQHQDLDKKTRSSFYIYAGQVELYHSVPDYTRALNFFDEAARLFEGDIVKRAYGEFYLTKGDYATAQEFFLFAIDLEPNNVDHYLFMGDSYRDQNNYKAANKWYKDATRVNFYDTNPYRKKIILRGLEKKLSTKEEKTQELIEKLNGLHFEHPESNLQYNSYRDIGYAYSYNEEWKQSIHYFEKAIALKPNLVSAYINLANVYVRIENFTEAEHYFEKAKQIKPDVFDIYWDSAYLFELKEEWLLAIKNYNICLRLRPTKTDLIHYHLGRIHEKADDFSVAIQHYQSALDQNPNHIGYVNNIKTLLQEKEGVKSAEQFLRGRISVTPQNPLLYNELGILLYQQEQNEEAVKEYLKAIELNPKEPVYFENVGLAYERLNNLEAAKQMYSKAISESPPNIGKYHNRMGYFLGTIEQHEEAVSYYEEAYRRAPSDSLYITNLGIGYNKANRRDDAIQIFEKVLEKDPKNSIALSEIGVALIWKEEFDKAKEYLERAIEVDPEDPHNYESLGHIYHMRQNYAEAEKIYKKGLLKNPEYHSLQNRMGSVVFFQNNISDAVDYYQNAVNLQANNEKYIADLQAAQQKLDEGLSLG